MILNNKKLLLGFTLGFLGNSVYNSIKKNVLNNSSNNNSFSKNTEKDDDIVNSFKELKEQAVLLESRLNELKKWYLFNSNIDEVIYFGVLKCFTRKSTI